MPKRTARLSLGDYAILGLLRERPMHGYEIARRFAADLDLGLVLSTDMSTVYTLLKDLHEHGLIDGEREVVGLRPPRTVYQLTRDAEEQFMQWLDEPVLRLREIRADLMVKLYFCRSMGTRAMVRLLDAQIVASREYVERMEELMRGVAADSFERLVRNSKVGVARATVAWLEEERSLLVG